MTRKIIGITGKKRAGKDTIANYIHKKYGFTIHRFADPIKDMIQQLLSYVDANDNFYMEQHKETEIVELKASYRKLAQTLGTEWGRNMISDSLWIDILAFNTQYEELIVIPDVRFDSEAEWIVNNNGFIIEVINPLTEQDEHISEAGINPKFINSVILNDSSFTNLYKQVDASLGEPSLSTLIKDAFISLMDGTSIRDIMELTGLSSNKADEIRNLYARISSD